MTLWHVISRTGNEMGLYFIPVALAKLGSKNINLSPFCIMSVLTLNLWIWFSRVWESLII